jgi:hypothetical protein
MILLACSDASLDERTAQTGALGELCTLRLRIYSLRNNSAADTRSPRRWMFVQGSHIFDLFRGNKKASIKAKEVVSSKVVNQKEKLGWI